MRNQQIRRLAALLALLLFLPLSAPAEEAWLIPEGEEEGAWPELNEAGYLDSGEFVYENPDRGLWRYCSETLRIEILRITETEPVKLIRYEAEIWSRKETFGFITN